MLKTTNILRNELKNYRYPDNKIARMVEAGELIPVHKGLYETDVTTPGYALAGAIYGRSYLSFEYALSYYGLIPERVYEYTSATYRKRKVKSYENAFGRYSYRDVPENVFFAGIRLLKYGDYYFQMASPQKALCDTLAKAAPVQNVSQLQALMLDDLRLDMGELRNLSVDRIKEVGSLYKNKNVKLLIKLLEATNG